MIGMPEFEAMKRRPLIVNTARGGLVDGGQVDPMCKRATNAIPQIEGKKVSVYAVTSLQRLPLAVPKDTPTLTEAGLPGFNVQVWHGLYAPRGTPPAVLAKLSAALKDPELIKRETALGLTVVNDKRLEPGGA